MILFGMDQEEGVSEEYLWIPRDVLLQFCKEVRVNSIVDVDVLALREGLLMLAASPWTSTHSFVFELDLRLVIAWVADPSSASWWFHSTFRKYCNIFRSQY